MVQQIQWELLNFDVVDIHQLNRWMDIETDEQLLQAMINSVRTGLIFPTEFVFPDILSIPQLCKSVATLRNIFKDFVLHFRK